MLAPVVAIALLSQTSLPSEAWAAPAPSSDPPPTGRGLIISGSVVLGVGLAAMIPGVVMMIMYRGSREGYGSAIGAMILGAGGVFVLTGTGLLVPGLVRRHRYREWQADPMNSAFGFAPVHPRMSFGPGGFVLRF